MLNKMSHLMTKPTKWSLCESLKSAWAPAQSDQSFHSVRSLDSWGPKVSSCGQRRLWSDWADAQADPSSLGAQVILLVLSWRGSNFWIKMTVTLFKEEAQLDKSSLPRGPQTVKKKWKSQLLGQGVEFDCFSSWSLPFYLFCPIHHRIKLQAMQDAPPLQLYPASDKFLMRNQRKAAKYL